MKTLRRWPRASILIAAIAIVTASVANCQSAGPTQKATGSNGSFAFDDIAPGKYWIVMRPAEVDNQKSTKSIRMDAALRAKIFQDAEALKKAVTLKPCEELADFALPYVAPASP